MLFPEYKKHIKLEDNITLIQCIKESESLFSELQKSEDTEEQVTNALADTNNLEQKTRIVNLYKKHRVTQEIISVKRLKNCKKNYQKLIFMPLIIKRNPCTIKHVRIFDKYFPLDPNIFLDVPSLNNN